MNNEMFLSLNEKIEKLQNDSISQEQRILDLEREVRHLEYKIEDLESNNDE